MRKVLERFGQDEVQRSQPEDGTHVRRVDNVWVGRYTEDCGNRVGCKDDVAALDDQQRYEERSCAPRPCLILSDHRCTPGSQVRKIHKAV